MIDDNGEVPVVLVGPSPSKRVVCIGSLVKVFDSSLSYGHLCPMAQGEATKQSITYACTIETAFGALLMFNAI